MKNAVGSLLEEFKGFAMRGNVIDLAVAVIIGTAFGKMVTALVNSILMPILGVLTGGQNLSGLMIRIGDARIMYGAFLQAVVDFLIVALCVFFLIKTMRKAQEALAGSSEGSGDEAGPDDVPEEIELLREIRDSLKR